MLTDFKKIYMKNSFEMIKLKLLRIAEEFKLDYEELEKLYLKDIKEYIEQN
jgi:hypothetical protein